MRKLTAKQTKLLKAEYAKLVKSGVKYPNYFDVNYHILFAIDNLHPCEVFSQNVDRLFDDLNAERSREGFRL